MAIDVNTYRVTAKHKNGSNNWVEWLLSDAVMQAFANMGIGNVVISTTAPGDTDVIWYRPDPTNSTQNPGVAFVHNGTSWVNAASDPGLAGWKFITGGGFTLTNNSIGNVHLANMAPGTVKGRLSTTGDPQDLTFSQVTSNLVPSNLVALLDSHFGNTVWRTHGSYDLDAGLTAISNNVTAMTVADIGTATHVLIRNTSGQVRWAPVQNTDTGGA